MKANKFIEDTFILKYSYIFYLQIFTKVFKKASFSTFLDEKIFNQ